MDRVRYTTREEFGFIFHISVQPGSYCVRVSGPQGYRHTFRGPRLNLDSCHDSLRSDKSAEPRKPYTSPSNLDDSASDADNDPSSNNGEEETEPSTHDSETGYRLGAGKGKGKSATLATIRLLRRTESEATSHDTQPHLKKPIHLDFDVDDPESASGSDDDDCALVGMSNESSTVSTETGHAGNDDGSSPPGRPKRSCTNTFTPSPKRSRLTSNLPVDSSQICVIDGVELRVEARDFYSDRVNTSKTRGGRIGGPGYQIDCPRTGKAECVVYRRKLDRWHARCGWCKRVHTMREFQNAGHHNLIQYQSFYFHEERAPAKT